MVKRCSPYADSPYMTSGVLQRSLAIANVRDEVEIEVEEGNDGREAPCLGHFVSFRR